MLRPLTTPYVADNLIVEPILSGSGMRDIVASAVVVGVPVLVLGLLSRGGASRERRLALVFALPSLAFLVAWWPVQGVDMEMDLIFATFPAFFAGAWLCARTRGATASALVLAALAHVGLWSVVRSDDFAAHSVPVIHVRWVDDLGDTQRTALEQSLGLSSAEHSGAGSTWRYRVPDVSSQRFDTIVAHDMVADTYGFDRGSLELDAPAGDVARLAAQPLVYTSGWYPAEPDATTPEATWQWTQQTGTLSFTNPNADAAFHLDYAARPDLVAGASGSGARPGNVVAGSGPPVALRAPSTPDPATTSISTASGMRVISPTSPAPTLNSTGRLSHRLLAQGVLRNDDAWT